jgi:hypothetical protein
MPFIFITEDLLGRPTPKIPNDYLAGLRINIKKHSEGSMEDDAGPPGSRLTQREWITSQGCVNGIRCRGEFLAVNRMVPQVR